MVQINWTIQAQNDLKDIALYISKDSKRYARLQVERIKKRTQVLKSYGFLGRKVPEFNQENIRELIEGNYRIIYKTVAEERIDILTIHHSAKDLNSRTV